MTIRKTVPALALLGVAAAAPQLHASEEAIQVWKSPTCGCCEMWVDHLRASGFEVVTEDVDDLAVIKQMAGVPDDLQSCHTAKVGDYVIEGHVPAVALERLLEQQPDVQGLAVPGMPAGSPGMPSPSPERYQVMTFGGGDSEPFATFVGPVEE